MARTKLATAASTVPVEANITTLAELDATVTTGVRGVSGAAMQESVGTSAAGSVLTLKYSPNRITQLLSVVTISGPRLYMRTLFNTWSEWQRFTLT